MNPFSMFIINGLRSAFKHVKTYFVFFLFLTVDVFERLQRSMKMLPEATQVVLGVRICGAGPHSSSPSFIQTMTNCLELPCGVVLHMDKE